MQVSPSEVASGPAEIRERLQTPRERSVRRRLSPAGLLARGSPLFTANDQAISLRTQEPPDSSFRSAAATASLSVRQPLQRLWSCRTTNLFCTYCSRSECRCPRRQLATETDVLLPHVVPMEDSLVRFAVSAKPVQRSDSYLPEQLSGQGVASPRAQNQAEDPEAHLGSACLPHL